VPKPPITLDLTWIGDLKFSGTSNKAAIVLDSAGEAGPSPVQTLAFALAGCMAMDVAYILTKGRYPYSAIRAHLKAERADEDPHRIVRAALTFAIDGDVPLDAIERAIALSREKYCSVWHSMRQDIDFTATWTTEDSGPDRPAPAPKQ
jgi:putative redox protein